MQTAWTKNLKSDVDQLHFQNSLRGAKKVLERLSDLLDEEEASIDRSELNVDTYDTASWSYKQAHKNGQRAMLRKIKNLITLDQEKTPL